MGPPALLDRLMTVDRLLCIALDLELQLREVAHEMQLRGPFKAPRGALLDRERYIRGELERVDDAFERLAAVVP